MKRWAITGGGGFIGSELARTLIQRGDRVRCLIRNESRALDGVEIVNGDVREAGAVSALVREVDVVVHLAAFVHRRAASRRAKRECHSVNVDGTRTVIAAIREHSPAPFLVHVSSSNVYPDLATPLAETDSTAPRTYYGTTKLASEQLVREAVTSGELRAAILRPAMVFGPGAPGNLRRLVGFVRRGRMVMIGDGENVKSMAPVETLIAAILAVAQDADLTTGHTYNVARGALSMRQIAALIADELGVTPKQTTLPLWPLLAAGRVIDVASTWTSLPSIAQMVSTYASSSVLATTKLEQLPSFRDDGDLEQALRATVRALSASQ